MAVRKSLEEAVVVRGTRDEWMPRCLSALESASFSKIEADGTLHQITARYRKATTWGDIVVTLTPEAGETRIHTRATANVDNIFALFSSPNRKILDRFKTGLE